MCHVMYHVLNFHHFLHFSLSSSPSLPMPLYGPLRALMNEESEDSEDSAPAGSNRGCKCPPNEPFYCEAE